MPDMMNTNRTSTSTQITNFYSEGYSCLNLRFYNTNLSFQWYPFTGKDQSGRSQYDNKGGQQTTVNREGAYALYHVANEILNGKVDEANITVPCLNGQVVLERKHGIDGSPETFLIINKNGSSIPFKFQTLTEQIRDNKGQVQTRVVESALGAFAKTVEGYLTGINADRHLDKLTEDYIRIQEQNQSQQQPGQQPMKNNNNKYRNNYSNNNNRPNYNNKYRNNNQYGGGNNSNNSGWNPQSQTLSNYELPED